MPTLPLVSGDRAYLLDNNGDYVVAESTALNVPLVTPNASLTSKACHVVALHRHGGDRQFHRPRGLHVRRHWPARHRAPIPHRPAVLAVYSVRSDLLAVWAQKCQ